MNEKNSECLAAIGGRGGFGNARFKTSTNQAPRNANPGEIGSELDLILQMKLLSDVGLVGLPNSGKSTFLSMTTNARPKIADYSFTTMEPQLGIVTIDDFNFTIADLPGLIRNASEGRGLGNRFLKHAERCSIILHLVDGSSEDPLENYRIVRREIESNKYKISDKTEIVAITKVDLLDSRTTRENAAKLQNALGKEISVISSKSMVGVEKILHRLKDLLKEAKKVD
jgi:GTP-binding protein